MIGEYLQHKGYNLRERLNLYTGPVVAVAYSTAFFRYVLLGDRISHDHEPLAWVAASLFNLPFILPEAVVGGVAGFFSAKWLKAKRSNLLKKIENGP